MIASACQITFLGMDGVDAARLEVRAWLPRLGALTDRVTGASVLIEAFDEHRKQRLYRCRMELILPDGMVVVTHEHPSNIAHEDLYVAIRNAFRAARRQLEEHFKTHPLPTPTPQVPQGRQVSQMSDAPIASGLAGETPGAPKPIAMEGTIEETIEETIEDESSQDATEPHVQNMVSS